MATRPRLSRKLVWIAVAIVTGAIIAWRVLAPESVVVATAVAARGPLVVTVDEDGRTRAVDRYVITSPVAGELERIPLRAGDAVAKGQALAHIQPLPLDERTRMQLQAARDAAAARASGARAALAQAEAAAEQAQRTLERRRALLDAGAISAEQLEQFELDARVRREERDAARQMADAAEADLQAARAALLGPSGGSVSITVRAPADGAIATIPDASARVVAAGETLMEVTDPTAIEVVVDVLSADAVRIQPGMHATLTGWGGEPLGATVRWIEPAAFTRISALGVEEQRVNVLLDLDHRAPGLGDGFRVEAAIRVWHADDVLRVPSSAVFRAPGDRGWQLFRVDRGRARLTTVEIGQRSGAETQITAGLEAGDVVVAFPSDALEDGTRVKPEG